MFDIVLVDAAAVGSFSKLYPGRFFYRSTIPLLKEQDIGYGICTGIFLKCLL